MKPYQKKATPKPMKAKATYHRWSEPDETFIRHTYDWKASDVAAALNLTVGQIRNKRAQLRKLDAAEKFVHVADAQAKAEVEALDKNLQRAWKHPLTSKEQDAKLKSFTLYEGIYDEGEPADDRTVWQRIGDIVKRVMRLA